MEVKVKENKHEPRYIELDLSPEDWANICEGRYPSKPIIVNEMPYTLSVGLSR